MGIAAGEKGELLTEQAVKVARRQVEQGPRAVRGEGIGQALIEVQALFVSGPELGVRAERTNDHPDATLPLQRRAQQAILSEDGLELLAPGVKADGPGAERISQELLLHFRHLWFPGRAYFALPHSQPAGGQDQGGRVPARLSRLSRRHQAKPELTQQIRLARESPCAALSGHFDAGAQAVVEQLGLQYQHRECDEVQRLARVGDGRTNCRFLWGGLRSVRLQRLPHVLFLFRHIQLKDL